MADETLYTKLKTHLGGWFEVLDNAGIVQDVLIPALLEIIKLHANEGKTIIPGNDCLFKAFRLCPNPKVLILGQDPYYNYIRGQQVADGLAFSTQVENYTPPSLMNIFDEIYNDVYAAQNIDFSDALFPNSDLTKWAEQGVLLLNASLTVEEKKPECHLNIWKDFTTHLLELINVEFDNIVVMLWGRKAKAYKDIFTNDTFLILESVHPSPLSANRGGWFGCNHFSQANKFLKHESIRW